MLVLKLIHVSKRGPRKWYIITPPMSPTVCENLCQWIKFTWTDVCILHCFYATINALAIFAIIGLGFSLSSGLVPSMSLNEACTKWPHILVHIFTHSPKVSGHDDIIKWKHFPRYWPFVRGIHRFPTQRAVTRSFDVLFELRLNKRLNKQT